MNGSKKWIFWTLGIVAVLGGVGFFIYKRKKNQLASSDKSNSGKGVVTTIVEGAKDVIKDVVGGEAKPVIGTENKETIDICLSRMLLLFCNKHFPKITSKYFPNTFVADEITGLFIGKINDIDYFYIVDSGHIDEKTGTWSKYIGYKKNNKWVKTPYDITFGKVSVYAESRNAQDEYIKPSTKISVEATKNPIQVDFVVNNFFKPTDKFNNFPENTKEYYNEQGVEEFCKKMKEAINQNFDKIVADAGGKLSFDGNFELSGGRNGGNILDSNL